MDQHTAVKKMEKLYVNGFPKLKKAEYSQATIIARVGKKHMTK